MDGNKSKRITNKRQFEILVKLMKENKHLAKGMKYAENFMCKDNYVLGWKDIATKLNSEGPPTRTESEWQKTWNDYKLKIKRKMIHNKKESSSTGGGPNTMHHFSNIEEDVIDLINMESCVNPTGKVFGLSCEEEVADLELPSHEAEEAQIEPGTLNSTLPIHPEVAGPSRKRKHSDSVPNGNRIEILKKQLNNSEEILLTLKEISRYQRKNYELKEKKFKFYKEIENKKLSLKIAKDERKKKEFEMTMEVMKCKKEKLELQLLQCDN